MIASDAPILLDRAGAWRTYLGGSMLAQLHGTTGEDGHFPEEWIMSLVCARNAGREAYPNEGLSYLAGTDVSLQSVLQEQPVAMLGRAHTAQLGATTGVLVKLIDAAERLTIQVHPDREKARALFDSDYGKTECWHILGGREIDGNTPCVYMGFRPGITREKWKALFEAQDITGMLEAMHRFEVKAGDTLLIEGGVPHAIGAGCFLAEIQEPTDYTIRTERLTPSGFPVADTMCHQGLGFERMFDCFDYVGLSAQEAQARWFLAPQTRRCEGGVITTLVGAPATQLFSMELVTVETCLKLDAAETFYGLYVLEGAGCFTAGSKKISFASAQQFFVPQAAGALTIENTQHAPIRMLRCFGPVVSAS